MKKRFLLVRRGLNPLVPQKQKLFLLVLSILFLVLLFSAFAQNESETASENSAQNLTGNITEEPAGNLDFSLTRKVDLLAEEINVINLKLTNLTSQIQIALETIQILIDGLQTLSSQQESFKANLNQNAYALDTVSTGLASLQINLDDAQTGVIGLEEQVAEIEKSRSFTKKAIIFLFFFAVFGGVLFYVFYYKTKLKINPELKKHIYQRLKRGGAYSSVRKELLAAGWPEEHVDSAYKNVLAYRYKKYLQTKPKPKPLFKKKAEEIDKRKIAIIAVVSVLLIVGGFFLLRATVGEAIQFQRIFAHEEPFICTPPHMVTEGGCCLDQNNNGVCDIDEEYEEGRAGEGASVCHDHRDCILGEVCIDNNCGVIRDQYRTDCEGQDKCSVNKIQILTSDGETYTLHAKKGSYTAAGALAWTIRPIPNYCKGEEVKIPIEVEKTGLVCHDDLQQEISCDQSTSISCRTDQDCTACPDIYGISCYCHNTDSIGVCVKDVIDKIDVEILSKEIIILTVGQTSEEIIHPNPNINKKLGGFKLTLQGVNEICFPG